MFESIFLKLDAGLMPWKDPKPTGMIPYGMEHAGMIQHNTIESGSGSESLIRCKEKH